MDPFKPHRNIGGSFSASEWRRRGAEAMFETAMALKEEADWVDRRLYYDEEHQVFRFKYDGTFAFSREHPNWSELERRGYSP